VAILFSLQRKWKILGLISAFRRLLSDPNSTFHSHDFHFVGAMPLKIFFSVLDQCENRPTAISRAANVAPVAPIAATASQQRKALLTELNKEPWKVRDDQGSEVGWRRLDHGEERNSGTEGLSSAQTSPRSSSGMVQWGDLRLSRRIPAKRPRQAADMVWGSSSTGVDLSRAHETSIVNVARAGPLARKSSQIGPSRRVLWRVPRSVTPPSPSMRWRTMSIHFDNVRHAVGQVLPTLR
jgi:hypothetical protein